ncbi:cupin domain-containing protein [Aquabacterium sp.]|uniref:cupin domain-containing protein n=1 Tax=Aquabacterium sp. TaxID=1872578 RepID=UPI0037840885
MTHDRLPPPRPAPDPLDDEWVGLLGEPFAAAWCQAAGRPAILRERVLDRVTRSARASRAFVTVRQKDAPLDALADGVHARTLYEATSRQLRPGEPRRVRIVELAAGACWRPELRDAEQSAWLPIAGELQLGELRLAPHDFHLRPAASGPAVATSPTGARFYLREAPGSPAADAVTVRDAEAGWDDFAPGIKRRVLWAGPGGEAALLYHALPGATVPRHGHGHDEECLMLEGEVFLDDLLLRQGEYQLAPAGTVHGGVSTDTGLLLFAHGDLALDLRPE